MYITLNMFADIGLIVFSGPPLTMPKFRENDKLPQNYLFCGSFFGPQHKGLSYNFVKFRNTHGGTT